MGGCLHGGEMWMYAERGEKKPEAKSEEIVAVVRGNAALGGCLN